MHSETNRRRVKPVWMHMKRLAGQASQCHSPRTERRFATLHHLSDPIRDAIEANATRDTQLLLQECLYSESVLRSCVDVDDFSAYLQRYFRDANACSELAFSAIAANNLLYRPTLSDQCGILAFAISKVQPVLQTTLFRATIPKNERSQSEGYELTCSIMNR
jgi:hypothetical protein